MRLDPATFADLCAFLDFDEWADEALIFDCATIKVNWLDDRDVFSEIDVDNSDVTHPRLVRERGTSGNRDATSFSCSLSGIRSAHDYERCPKGLARSRIETTVRA